MAGRNANNRETHMSGRLETWRLEAYNAAKQSENKMHDDTVANRFGFSGGLVPGDWPHAQGRDVGPPWFGWRHAGG